MAVARSVAGLADCAAAPAVACAGLVGANGTIKLDRTATLAAYHDGVERYVTSFSYSGEGKEVGAIVPLPGVPSKVERGGDWTLQRLQREVQPPPSARFSEDSSSRVLAAGRPHHGAASQTCGSGEPTSTGVFAVQDPDQVSGTV